MIELFKNKQYRRLFISLAALDAAQLYIWYVFWNWIYDAGDGFELEISFIIYSAIIVLALILIPRLIVRRNLLQQPQILRIITLTSIGAALASLFLALLPGISALVVSLSLITAFIFIPHAICLTRFAREIPKKIIGRAVGLIVAVSMVFAYISVLLIDELENTILAYIAFAALLAVAAAFFQPEVSEAPTNEEKHPVYSRKLIIVGVLAIFCYAVVAGLDDNIRYIVEIENDFDGIFAVWFVFLVGAAIYLLAGFLLDVLKSSKYLIVGCLVAICAIFSLLLAVDTEIVEITYFFGSKLPIYSLWVISIVLPLRNSKHQPQLAGFGYAMLYFGMLLTSVLFLVFPDIYYLAIALVLGFTVAAFGLFHYLYSDYEREQFATELSSNKEEIASLKKMRDDAEAKRGQRVEISSLIAEYKLTEREGELLPLLLSPLTAGEIAKSEQTSEATVKYHISSILQKTGCKNRRALQLFVDGDPANHKQDNSTEV